MLKFTLKAAPTFSATVDIPVAGKQPAPVQFTFKHRAKKDLEAWLAGARERTDLQMVMDLACGWDLEEPFDGSNVAELLENYAGAALAMLSVYLRELSVGRLGN